MFILWSIGRPPSVSAGNHFTFNCVKSRLAVAVAKQLLSRARAYLSSPSLFEHLSSNTCRLLTVVQGCHGVSLAGDFQNPPGHVPVAPALGDPTLAGGLDQRFFPTLTILRVFEYCEI